MKTQNKSQLEKCLDTFKRLLYSTNSKEIEILSKVLRSQASNLTEEELQIFDTKGEEIANKYYEETLI